MSERRNPAVYSIPPHRAFADALAEGLISQFGKDRLRLAQGIVLVPNNRAGQAVRDAFVRQSEGGLLLPRLVVIGDSDLGERVGGALDFIDDEPIPPAVSPLKRQLMLAAMLQNHGWSGGALDGAQAVRLAADLARVIDQLIVEDKSVSDLRDVDLGLLSDHWAASLELLQVILTQWPEQLARLGCIDLSERRNRQLKAVAERWRKHPPAGFVVAAGISSGAPAIAALVRQVSRMERGQVVVAGVDFDLPDEAWQSLIGEEGKPSLDSHPQHHLRLMLDRIGVARANVEPWPWGRDDKEGSARGRAISHGLAPAKFTKHWTALPARDRKLPGVSAFEAPTPGAEAQAIALALRHSLETPNRTAALVTPDRDLSRRVVAHLARWGVDANDTAGEPLSVTESGAFFLALAEASAEGFAPVPLLALLKHPLAKGSGDRLEWLDGARALDLALRGPLPAPGLNGVEARLEKSAAREWWEGAKALLFPLETVINDGASLAGVIAALREAATALTDGSLWAGSAGRALAQLIEDLEAEADILPKVDRASLPALLRTLFDAIAVRPEFGGHPRINIWGLLEAKLQSADLMILGGLNEDSWPQIAEADPWLAPTIRRQLGLPALEQRIGLAAHDLASAMSAQEVILTRAKRDARSRTTPSRFWLRLETLADGFEPPEPRYDLMALALDYAEAARAIRPAPCPPTNERPRKLSITEVDTLKADPFAFYAKRILGLRRLDVPGAEPDARWRGTFMHDVLADWGQKDDFAVGKLTPRLRAAFDASGLHPLLVSLWLPRMEAAAETFCAKVQEMRAEGRKPIFAEKGGEIEIVGVTLNGRADRIDQLADGSLGIIDYKTGDKPTNRQVKDGYAMQLGLLGLMAEMGAFDGITGRTSIFEYWSQSKSGDEIGKVRTPVGTGKTQSDPKTFVATTRDQFIAAAEQWLNGDAPFTAKLHPDYAFTDYDQLMRYDEWQGS